MACSKKSLGAVAALPDDPLVEILCRVPAKSLCRFKCVSKAWRDLIADPHHRKKLPQAMQGLFLMVLEVDSFSFRINFSFVDLTVRSVPLDIDPAFSFLTERPGFEDLSLKDSCNGLVLFNHEELLDTETLGYVVCNPTTKRWVEVPRTCGSPDLSTWVYLVFEPAVSAHFHLVQFKVSTDEADDVYEELVSLHVYSSETGTWSGNQIGSQENEGTLEEWLHYTMPPHGDPEYAFVNGFLHFIVWDWDSDLVQILVVDVEGKARRVITAPNGGHFYCYYRLAQSQGCLHYMTNERLEHGLDYKLSIWVLQDYDTKDEEWVLKKTVSSLEIFGELSRGPPNFQIVGMHQDCNVVFFWQSKHKLIAYDMDRNELSVISTFKDQKISIRFAHYVPCFSELPALTNSTESVCN